MGVGAGGTDEHAAIRGWQRGDEAAVRAVFDAYYPRTLRLAALSGLARAEAEDCAQEAFVHAFERRAQLRDVKAFLQAGVTQLSLTLDVSRVYALNAANSKGVTLAGPWHFTFTLPWHTQSLGAGGPYAQPTTPPSR
jgi:hypothetical protein